VWHGTVVRALRVLAALEVDHDGDQTSPEQRKLRKALTERGGSLPAGASSVPSSGERSR
jgi:hypothetical protein